MQGETDHPADPFTKLYIKDIRNMKRLVHSLKKFFSQIIQNEKKAFIN